MLSKVKLSVKWFFDHLIFQDQTIVFTFMLTWIQEKSSIKPFLSTQKEWQVEFNRREQTLLKDKKPQKSYVMGKFSSDVFCNPLT